MIETIKTILAIFSIIFVAFLWVYTVYLMRKTKGTPTLGTFLVHRKYLKQINYKSNSKILDFGCGYGTALRVFAKTGKFKQLDGVDINFMGLGLGKLINFMLAKTHIKLKYGNIFKTDFSDYDYIYTFLMPSIMPEVSEYIKENIKEGQTIICNAFKMPQNYKPIQVIKNDRGVNLLFIYDKSSFK